MVTNGVPVEVTVASPEMLELTATTEPGAAWCASPRRSPRSCATRAAEHDREASFPHASVDALKRAGYFTAPIPAEHGGLGVTSVHDVVVASSRLARGDASVAIGVNMHLVDRAEHRARAGRPRSRAGDERRAAAFGASMAAIARDGVVMATAISELGQDLTRPAHDGDPHAARAGGSTAARRSAPMSPAATVLYTAVTFVDDDGVERYGYAPVPPDAAGVEIHGDWDALGMRASGSHSVTFTGVEVPRAALRGGFLGRRREAYMERNLVAGPVPRVGLAGHRGERGGGCHRRAVAREPDRAFARRWSPRTRSSSAPAGRRCRAPRRWSTTATASSSRCSPRRRRRRRSSTRRRPGSSTARSRCRAAPATSTATRSRARTATSAPAASCTRSAPTAPTTCSATSRSAATTSCTEDARRHASRSSRSSTSAVCGRVRPLRDRRRVRHDRGRRHAARADRQLVHRRLAGPAAGLVLPGARLLTWRRMRLAGDFAVNVLGRTTAASPARRRARRGPLRGARARCARGDRVRHSRPSTPPATTGSSSAASARLRLSAERATRSSTSPAASAPSTPTTRRSHVRIPRTHRRHHRTARPRARDVPRRRLAARRRLPLRDRPRARRAARLSRPPGSTPCRPRRSRRSPASATSSTWRRSQPGETVLDLGSGSGTDSFIAADLVGPAGRVTGVDMTDAQLAKARRLRDGLGLHHVTFVEGLIEEPPVAPGSVDVVISNGVINLAPDKDAVFRAVARALRPGGRLALADIVAARELIEPRGATSRCGRRASPARSRRTTTSTRSRPPACRSSACARTRTTASSRRARRRPRTSTAWRA